MEHTPFFQCYMSGKWSAKKAFAGVEKTECLKDTALTLKKKPSI